MKKILVLVVVCAALAVFGCSQSLPEDTSENAEMQSVEPESTPAPTTYSFALPRIVNISEEVPEDFSVDALLSYVPGSDMTQYFDGKLGETALPFVRYIWSPSPIEGSLFNSLSSYGDGVDVPGSVAAAPDQHCLTQNGSPWLLMPGTALEDGGNVYETVPYFFSVKAPAGDFTDCLCCVRRFVLEDGSEGTVASFFAPGQGVVLTTTNEAAVDGVYVMEVLTQSVDGTGEMAFNPALYEISTEE